MCASKALVLQLCSLVPLLGFHSVERVSNSSAGVLVRSPSPWRDTADGVSPVLDISHICHRRQLQRSVASHSSQQGLDGSVSLLSLLLPAHIKHFSEGSWCRVGALLVHGSGIKFDSPPTAELLSPSSSRTCRHFLVHFVAEDGSSCHGFLHGQGLHVPFLIGGAGLCHVAAMGFGGIDPVALDGGASRTAVQQVAFLTMVGGLASGRLSLRVIATVLKGLRMVGVFATDGSHGPFYSVALVAFLMEAGLS